MSDRLADYEYDLPRELIAQRPLPRREDARMMILRREKKSIEHGRFIDFPSFLQTGDFLVLNDSRVLPARHFSDDGKIEFLFLRKLSDRVWAALVKPGRKFRAAVTIAGIVARPGETLSDGAREVIFDSEFDAHAGGAMPLPPYMNRAPEREDATRYQTVYAREDGSLAAPTAGLHFTGEILRQVPHTFVTLHVGTGTFRPVKTEDITGHQMHPETFSISSEAARAIQMAKRIVAVGTTTVRVLETVQRRSNKICATADETNLFIHPPFEFQVVDAMLTNFHLPRSTLLMLVSAFAGREFILRAYAEAVRESYRFFSYGDCMLIL